MTKRGRPYLFWLFWGAAFFLISGGTAFGLDPVNVDGTLDEWTFLDRLDLTPGQTPAGYELYGRYENETYYFAIKANGTPIGSNTTIWLNTDQDPGTGVGWAGGAEFYINFFTDSPSTPHLYNKSWAWVSGPLVHAYGSGDTVVEIALPEALMGASVGDIDVFMDINDAVSLPADYANDLPYTLNLFSEWTSLDRLDLAPVQKQPGYELYGHYESGTYYLKIKTDGTPIGPNTTIWLDTDQDPGTGTGVWDWLGGFDFNINIYPFDSKPYLYTGAAAENYLTGPLVHAYGSGDTVIEIALPEALMGPSIGDIDILMDINDALLLPSDYVNFPPYTLTYQELPKRTDFSKRVGIVFSQTTSDHFFDDKAYAQLFQAIQHQAMMAGIPFVVLTEDDLTDIANLVNLDALIFPYFAYVPRANLAQTKTTLLKAVYGGQIGIIAAGDFMTNDETGAVYPPNAYTRSRLLLDMQPVAFYGPVDFVLAAQEVTHPVMKDYTAGEEILSYTGGNNWTASYSGTATTPVVLANQDIAAVGTVNAVLATETGGRNVHFGSISMMGDSNLVWPALRWVVYGSDTPIGLQLSRFDSLFLSRTDMDQSMFPADLPSVAFPLLDVITDWKAGYDFVGSFYINIGSSPPDETTDWNVSGPLYQDYMALGNEIGTHSYTHPDDIDDPTVDLHFEFMGSRSEIDTQLSITVEGAAVPGNPESLATDLILDPWFSYVSGTYSNVGSGYPGAFGFLTPAFNNLYFNLNMKPDFTLIGWEGKTPTEAVDAWTEEFDALTFRASTPIIHWLWHDYGATQFQPGYTWEMYDNTLAMAFNANTEFTTLANACDRIHAFTAADVTVTENGAITADVAGTGIGQFALSVDSEDVIQSVIDWYAYSDRTVFVPRNGGTFTMQLGPTQDDRTRIVSLPMRADLISVTGDGAHLAFEFEGEGKVVAYLNAPEGAEPYVQGADSVTLNADILEMDFDGFHEHTASVLFTYELTMAVDPAEGGTTDPAVGTHTKGWEEEVTVTATDKPGYTFSHWTGDVADTSAPSTTVTMDADKTVTAHFSRDIGAAAKSLAAIYLLLLNDDTGPYATIRR
ncbi:MAG: hypothetical protein SWE60_07375 [Thermodesulfobacteriota bacterium]|nr:hypothetical protein [Thermodesulfobacteriota bacterium]